MRFIVDAQLPKSLADFFNFKGYDAIHTIDLPAKNQTKDIDITEFSTFENRIVITKDVDFLEAYLLKAQPKN